MESLSHSHFSFVVILSYQEDYLWVPIQPEFNGVFVASAEALAILCVWCVRWERERERERERDRQTDRQTGRQLKKEVTEEGPVVRNVFNHEQRRLRVATGGGGGGDNFLDRQTDRQTETETDGSDVTIVALKLAMSLHFPLPNLKFARFVYPFTLSVSPFLRGAWRDRDTNDIFAHCSLIFYFLDFKFSNFVCFSELYPLIWFFFKNSFRKKKNIRKTTQNALAPSIFIVLLNRAETWYTASTHPSAKYVVTEFLISL